MLWTPNIRYLFHISLLPLIHIGARSIRSTSSRYKKGYNNKLTSFYDRTRDFNLEASPAWMRIKELSFVIVPIQSEYWNKCRGNFTCMWPCNVTRDRATWQIFFMVKPIRRINFSNLFWNKTLHILDSSSVHHQELFTVHSGFSSLILLDSCLRTCMTYTIVECTVNNSWWWTEELSETCRVSFQNEFEKLVRLNSFIIKKKV
jgi:hypothetical protein